MGWLEMAYVFLYFFSMMYLPWILLAVSLWFSLLGLVYNSWKKMAVGFLFFLPDLIALMVLELEPILYGLVLLPLFQIVMTVKYYRSEKILEKSNPQATN